MLRVQRHYTAFLRGGIFGDQVNREELDRDAFVAEVQAYCDKLQTRLAFDDRVTMWVTASIRLPWGWHASRTSREVGTFHLIKGADAPRLVWATGGS
jgi:hypothetical protein